MKPTAERGVAMVLVVIWTAVALLLALITTQAVIAAVKPSDINEASYQAMAAAEAGIDDYRSRLALVGTPAGVAAQANSALAGRWRAIPGGSSDAYFTYALVDDSTASQAGTIRLRSTGYYRGQTRTLDVVLRKRTTYDYAYLSANETIAPNMPGVYTGQGQKMDDSEATFLCGNVWYQSAYKAIATPLELGTHRNSRVCQFISVQPGDVYDGDVHSNDAWYFDGDLTGVFGGRVTSSCPDGNGQAGCPPAQRWIGNIARFLPPADGNKNSDYIANEIPTPYQSVAWNPEYDTPLELPPTPVALRQQAIDGGCYFRGPTRIRWVEGGTLLITSPDTQNTEINSFCIQAGKSYRATAASSHATMQLNYSAMVDAGFNGVLYVDSIAANDTSAPSCQTKSTGTRYPFVIPAVSTFDEELPRTFPSWVDPSSAGTPFGFPHPTTNDPRETTATTADPWAAGFCGQGIAYVQGAYRGSQTLAAAWDIVLTGHLVDENLKSANWQTPANVTTYGVPPESSTNSLGLIPSRFLYVYLPNSNWANGWNAANVTNLVVDAAATILNGCFTVQDQSINSALGSVFWIGSLSQKYHCRVERENYNGQGYRDFYIRYDSRYARTVAPPGMADLFTEPWAVTQISELNPSTVTVPNPPTTP